MSTRLVVDSSNHLQEFRQPGFPSQPPVIRVLAKLLSVIFHPLFVPVYIVYFLLAEQPHLFAAFTPKEKTFVIIRFFVIYTFFPLVTILLAKGLGFLSSIYLRTQKERIIPYIACGIFYFWSWWILHNQPQFARETESLAMAIWIACSLGLMANIYMKVSMHAMSMGVLLAFMMLLTLSQGVRFGLFMSVALLVAGLVCSARLIVSDHTQKELYTGLFIGVLSQLIANWVV